MFQEESKRTEIGTLGEFGLIEAITKNVKLRNTSSEKGIGDDAAVIDYGTDSKSTKIKVRILKAKKRRYGS